MASKEVRVAMPETADVPEALLREAKEAQGPLRRDGMLYLIRGEKVFSCEDTPEGQALMDALFRGGAGEETPGQALRSLLQSGKRAEEIVRRCRIPAGGLRCILLLQCTNRRDQNPEDVIRTVAPLEKEDLLLRFSADTAALIKQGSDPEEAAEYAMALIDTVEGETGLRLRAGVSEPKADPGLWAEGCREAEQALETGRIFHLKDPVQIYRKQILERMLQEIPAERRRALRRELLTAGGERALNDELMETADEFFRSDLNLSDTARRMFIHRNTLTYRLDKIRKETGLDLRRFSDAVIFRLVTALPEDPDEMKKDER